MQKTTQPGDIDPLPSEAQPPSRRWPRRPPSGVAGATFWVALCFGLLLLLRLTMHQRAWLTGLLGLGLFLSGLALVVLGILLAWRLVHRHLMWSLRNKLILTYLLIGLAPVVMLLTFVAISAYIAAGQFSIHLADTRIQQQLDELGVEGSSSASRIARMMRFRNMQPMGAPGQGRPGFQFRSQPLEPGARPGARPGATGRSAPGAGRPGTRSSAPGSAARAASQPAVRPAPQTAAQETPAQLAAQLAAQASSQTTAPDVTVPDPLLTRLHHHSSIYLNGKLYSIVSLFATPYATPQPAAKGLRPSAALESNRALHPTPALHPNPALQSNRVPGLSSPPHSNPALRSRPTLHSKPTPQPKPEPQPSRGLQSNLTTPQPGQPPGRYANRPGKPQGLPPWADNLHGNQFRGLVLDGHSLFLVAIDQRRIEGVGLLTVITSLPVDSSLMDVVAEGLGRVQLIGMANERQRNARSNRAAAASGRTRLRPPGQNGLQHLSVYGGVQSPAAYFYDPVVPFLSTLDVREWQTGELNNVPVLVHSRPSVLYRQLFGSSLGGVITQAIRTGLIALCIIFALIEALALWMALRLSRAITTSVEELYAATQRVDRGDLTHRIEAAPVEKRDQLGELSRSFNRMTESLERLLIEQQEKERMQSELAIAQEVQDNLFPRRVRDLPRLQLHGVCHPARSVSGDYYDFLIFRHPNHADGSRGEESGVGIALGDISGKGISAALLMATLHSAVRAYRLAGEDLVYSESAIAALTASREDLAGDGGKLFESPGRILSLLNRHLYRSTQPEKYATLFLAHYDAASAELTYSNAGHLPPLVLSRDGSVRRLDHGGTVVGLMDGMRYEEDRFQMKPGDLLVAYSDGITEPENTFGEFGEERMMEIVTRLRDQPLEVISAQVLQAVNAWIGTAEQPDDITLVLARQL